MSGETAAWLLIGTGVAIAFVGLIVLLLAKAGLSGFPGTISFEGEGVSIYVPIIASIVASIVLTIVLNIFVRLR
jgi:hypothetical protein